MISESGLLFWATMYTLRETTTDNLLKLSY